MSNKKTFVVDAMLGKLSKKLRLLGYDTVYSSDIDDDKLIQLAKDENRIIISKDSQLVKKAIKQNLTTILISETEEIKQFREINEKIILEKLIEGGKSRCTICNGVLSKIEKKDVDGKIPKGVLENTEEFWKCEKCQKIYWEGSHIRNLQKFTAKLNDRF